ncbi:hypothetical protein DFQ26_005003 [Actinomortierella ambigua]|nr:hypothetical protein DFQ26_005003 [Actinomortierella ambigua]
MSQLPVECLEYIVEHLEDDSATLYSLLTTNRLLFLIALKVLYKSPFRLIATIPAPCSPYQDLVRKYVHHETASSQTENTVQPVVAASATNDPGQPLSPSSTAKLDVSEGAFTYSVESSAIPTTSGVGDEGMWGELIHPHTLPFEFSSHPATDTAWLAPQGTAGLTPTSGLENDSWPTTAEEELNATSRADELLSKETMMQHVALRQRVQRDRSSWSRFMRRTELLGRLLLLSVDIPGVQERVPRLQERFIPTKAHQTPPIAPSAMSPTMGRENASTFGDVLLTSLLDGSVRPTASILDAPTTNIPDLISFVDLELDGISEETDPQENEDIQLQAQFKPTVDYFQYYTQLDHSGLWSVLTLLFPGAGRRVYDRIQAEIELGILKYCAPRIESMKITNPQLVIPYMLEHDAEFVRLKEIELLDKSWKANELKLVHDFLVAHARRFPSATAFTSTSITNDQPNEENPPSFLRTSTVVARTMKAGCRILSADRPLAFSCNSSGIRRLKYRSSRSPWDNVCLNGQRFDPLQLLLALGPGIREIDMLYWPTTQLLDVLHGNVDAGAIRRLQLRYLDTPSEPSPWHAPEFLRQCRQLDQLRVFTLDGTMFSWAVQEQQARWLRVHQQRQPQHRRDHSRVERLVADSLAATTSTSSPQNPVPLRDLGLTAPDGNVMRQVAAGTLYAFQQTLESVDLRSRSEGRDLAPFDPSLIGDELTRRPLSSKSTPNPYAIFCQRDAMHQANSEKQEQAETDTWEEDDDGFRSWMLQAPLTVRWPMERLRELRLTGGKLALEFDLDSLQWMPNLHTLALSIRRGALQNERFRWTCNREPFTTLTPPSTGKPSSLSTPSSPQTPMKHQSLMYLPYVAGPQLRRIMFQGPWPEISDCTLDKMIRVAVDTPPSLLRPYPSHAPSPSPKTQWGDHLLELTVLDNPEVTVQGMTHLAACLEHVQIVGFNTNICKRTATLSWQRYQRLKRMARQNKLRPLRTRGVWDMAPKTVKKDEKVYEGDDDWTWDWWVSDYKDHLPDYDEDEDDDGSLGEEEEEEEEEDALAEIWPDARPLSPLPAASETSTNEHDDYLRRQQQWVEQHQRRDEEPTEDLSHVVKDWLLRAQVALPWVDMGPDAQHLGHRTTTVRHSEHGWMS